MLCSFCWALLIELPRVFFCSYIQYLSFSAARPAAALVFLVSGLECFQVRAQEPQDRSVLPFGLDAPFGFEASNALHMDFQAVGGLFGAWGMVFNCFGLCK